MTDSNIPANVIQALHKQVTGLSAFPRPASVASSSMQAVPEQSGMTLLDHFAGLAMQCLLTKSLTTADAHDALNFDSGWWDNIPEDIAARSYVIAAAMVLYRPTATEIGMKNALESHGINVDEGGAA